MIPQLILVYFANLYNPSMFKMHCLDVNPYTYTASIEYDKVLPCFLAWPIVQLIRAANDPSVQVRQTHPYSYQRRAFDFEG